MTNNWNIPEDIEKTVKNRDKHCVYCHKKFKNNPSDKATWEHIDNNEKNISEENIAICCASCNASKGTKDLLVWLNSDYCKKKNINNNTVAENIKMHIRINEIHLNNRGKDLKEK